MYSFNFENLHRRSVIKLQRQNISLLATGDKALLLLFFVSLCILYSQLMYV